MPSPMLEPNETTAANAEKETSHELLVHLAAGELGSLAAWRLRRQIARDPELAREWHEIQALWRDMKSLQTADARPRWADRTGSAALADRPSRSRKGIAVILTPRIALAACSIVSLALGGTVVASHYHLFSPVPMMSRENCQVVLRNPGQVKLFDANGQFLGSYDKTIETAPSLISPDRGLVADLYVDNYQTVVEGRGMQPVRDTRNKLIGYAELTPYSLAIRVAENAQPAPTSPVTPAEKAPPAPMADHPAQPAGAPETTVHIEGTDGWNKTFGTIDDNLGRYDWEFIDVGTVRFRREDTGETLFESTAHRLSKARRAQLQKELSPREFALRVGPGNPDNPGHPLFNVSIRSKLSHNTYQFSGYTTERLLLPNGMALLVDMLPPRN